MPLSPGLTSTWGQQDWSPVLLEALQQESAILRAGARRIVGNGRTISVPRIKVNPAASWVAEATELPTDSGDADTLVFTPKKLGNVIAISREAVEDAPIDELSAVGTAMIRGVASAIDTRAFSASASTATAPAGLLHSSWSLPSGTGSSITIARLVSAVGKVAEAGGKADVIFIHPADLTAVRSEALTGAFATLADPTAPGVEQIAGAKLIPAPFAAAGTAVACQASYLCLAVRRDISVEFSADAMFTKDSVAARVTARVDWAPSDPAAIFVAKPSS